MGKTINAGRREHPDTNRWSDDYLEEQERYPITSGDLCANENLAYRPPVGKLVNGGAWVMVIQPVPVNEITRPQRWAIYWAVPCRDSQNYDGYDEGGRYKVSILVPCNGLLMGARMTGAPEYIGLFPHEYTIIPESLLKEEMDDGHYEIMQVTRSTSEDAMSIKLIERGRSLTEEERESIWALMLDGLTELQACQEYFMSRHVDTDNAAIWYRPVAELVEYYDDIFSWSSEVGKPLQPRERVAQ